MNIALLTEKYTPDIGGLAISTERLARLLTSAGHNVRVFAPTLNLPPSEKRTLISSGVSVTRSGARKRVDDTLVDWFEIIIEQHKREPFNILHAYFLTQAGFVAAYAGKYLNIPSVVSIRGNDIERAAFDLSRFSHTMFALQNASAVTTNARELVKKTKALFDREIHLIPNGIDAEHFKPTERNEALAEALGLTRNVTLSASEGSLSLNSETLTCTCVRRKRRSQQTLPQSDMTSVIGFVGELREKKGLQILLSAYAQVAKIQPTAFLMIVGEVRQGEDKQTFDDFRCANPQLPITVTGYISHNELPSYYSLIDIFVHPSLRDGMPNALLEAMACGKAVVATPVGGILDVLEDGKNGVIVNVNDVNRLAEKIIELLDDPAKRNFLGKNARDTVLKKFPPANELEANLEVYRKLGITS
jgi:glycosyltransferase involved in cell wall biosynthesis